MLPPFIIEQIRRREEDELRRREDLERPRLELPVDAWQPMPEPRPHEPSPEQRGVIILDLG